MNAWLIINKYHVSNSFYDLEKLLLESAKKHNIDLTVYNNVEIMKAMSNIEYVKPDFVLFWDKDVKLAKYIESEGIKIFNSSDSIRLCDDKSLTYLHLRNKCIKMPKTIFSPLLYYHEIYEDKEFVDFVIEHIGFPFIFKECFGSFGKQVYLVNNKEEFIERIKQSTTWPFEIQEFIKTSFGRDLRVYVVGDKAIGGMQRVNDSGDFRANIEIGGVGKKFDLSIEHEELAIKVTKALNLDFAGVDILFGENDEPILCEVNSNAYFISFDKVLGVKVEDYIFDHILNSI